LELWKVVAEHIEDLDLFLLSFDVEITAEVCDHPQIHCVLGQGTTWTTGRNLLAKTMFQVEKASGNAVFNYWIFTDEDMLSIQCDACRDKPDCAPPCLDSLIDRYMRTPATPPPIIGIRGGVCEDASWDFQELLGMDGMFSAFHRYAVPFMIPYFTDLDSYSWWESQVISFFPAAACLNPNHSMMELNACYYRGTQQKHAEYPKGSLYPTFPKRREAFQSRAGTRGIDVPQWDIPCTECRPKDTPFNGNMSPWLSGNGKRWWDFYGARMCTARLHEVFDANCQE